MHQYALTLEHPLVAGLEEYFTPEFNNILSYGCSYESTATYLEEIHGKSMKIQVKVQLLWLYSTICMLEEWKKEQPEGCSCGQWGCESYTMVVQ